MATFANVTMLTDYLGHTVKTSETPVRLRAPKGAETALNLDANAEYAVALQKIKPGYRLVTDDERARFDKPTDVVRFFSTATVHDGAWKKVKDKEDVSWHAVPYIVPNDYSFFTCDLVVNGEVVVTDITEDQMKAIVTLLDPQG